MPECLTGLPTAKDLILDISLDNIYKFIMKNLGPIHIKGQGLYYGRTYIDEGDCDIDETMGKIHETLEDEDEDIKKMIVSSLDLFPFTKAELVALVRQTTDLSSKRINQVDIFKDHIFVSQAHGQNCNCDNPAVYFYPQHYKKISKTYY